jgi:hypothetical protein
MLVMMIGVGFDTIGRRVLCFHFHRLVTTAFSVDAARVVGLGLCSGMVSVAR